jgi:hypothetical protein
MYVNRKELGITSKEYEYILKRALTVTPKFMLPLNLILPLSLILLLNLILPLSISTHSNYSLTYPTYPFSSPPLASKHKKAS